MESILYKYRPWNDRTKDILQQNRLYIPTAFEFNDPFDARPLFAFSASKNRIKAKLREVQMRGHVPEIKALPRRVLNQMARHSSFEKTLSNAAAARWNTALSTLGIVCLTPVANSILMWSHYADRHHGICLGFGTGDSGIFGTAQKVIYSEDYPTFNYITQRIEDVSDIILRKAAEWSYECEFRLVGKRGVLFLQFKPEILEAVVIGCSMSRSDKSELRAILKTRAAPILLIEARRAANRFHIDLIEIEHLNP